jgi:hypothetical protein
MSKVAKILGLAVIVAVVVTAITVSFALADPPVPDDGDSSPGSDRGTYYGPLMMGEWSRPGMMGGWYGPGMRGGYYGGGWMADYRDEMHAAVAEALGLSVEELDAAMAEGQTMWQIAEEQGVDPEVIRDAMQDAREEAINQAVADGVLTQEQADWMLGRIAPSDESGAYRTGPRWGIGCWR